MNPLAFGFTVVGLCGALLALGCLVSLWAGAGKKSETWAMLAPIVIVPSTGLAIVGLVLGVVFR